MSYSHPVRLRPNVGTPSRVPMVTTEMDDPIVRKTGLATIGRRTRDVEASERLLADHLPLVRRLCRRFSHSGEPLEDLVQVGSIGLIKAIAKYDPDRGNGFVAFAVPVIVGEIKNYFRDHGWAVKVPRKLQRQKRVVEKAIESLSQSLGRAPTMPEIAEATGFSEEEVYDTFDVEGYGKPLSLDTEYCNGNGGEEVSTLLDFVGGEDPRLEDLSERLDLADALQSLNGQEATVIRLKFYTGLSQTEIANRLGVSQMHVSRLQRNALGKLKRNLAR